MWSNFLAPVTRRAAVFWSDCSLSYVKYARVQPKLVSRSKNDGIVVGIVRRMNEVTLRRARLVFGWVTVCGWVYILVCNKPTRSTPGSLHRVPASTGLGGNVTSAGWQVTPCDTIWHMSSHSSQHVANCYTLFTFTITKHASYQ